MFKRTGLIIIALTAIFVFSKTSSGQSAHMGIYFSSPHVRIIAGEPALIPYRTYYYQPVYHRHYYGVRNYYNYYYPHKQYYRERFSYRHDNGRHKGWYKNKYKWHR